MILPRIGSLKVVGKLNRFQRKLESPLLSLPICHSSESWNLPKLSSFRKRESIITMPEELASVNFKFHSPFGRKTGAYDFSIDIRPI